MSRKTVHAWLAKYEADGLEGLAHPSWGPRRLVFELAKSGVAVVSESAAYRALVRPRMPDW